MTSGVPRIKCTATKTNGEPCQRAPIKGGTACYTHGGAVPHVIKAARVRMAMASRNAVEVLVGMLQDESVAPRDRIKAATELLSRAGIGTNQTVELEVGIKPWEQLLMDTWVEGDDGMLIDVALPGDNFGTVGTYNEVVYERVGDAYEAHEARKDAESEERQRVRAIRQKHGSNGAQTPAELRERELKAKALEAETRAAVNDRVHDQVTHKAVSGPQSGQADRPKRRVRRPR